MLAILIALIITGNNNDIASLVCVCATEGSPPPVIVNCQSSTSECVHVFSALCEWSRRERYILIISLPHYFTHTHKLHHRLCPLRRRQCSVNLNNSANNNKLRHLASHYGESITWHAMKRARISEAACQIFKLICLIVNELKGRQCVGKRVEQNRPCAVLCQAVAVCCPHCTAPGHNNNVPAVLIIDRRKEMTIRPSSMCVCRGKHNQQAMAIIYIYEYYKQI